MIVKINYIIMQQKKEHPGFYRRNYKKCGELCLCGGNDKYKKYIDDKLEKKIVSKNEKNENLSNYIDDIFKNKIPNFKQEHTNIYFFNRIIKKFNKKINRLIYSINKENFSSTYDTIKKYTDFFVGIIKKYDYFAWESIYTNIKLNIYNNIKKKELIYLLFEHPGKYIDNEHKYGIKYNMNYDKLMMRDLEYDFLSNISNYDDPIKKIDDFSIYFSFDPKYVKNIINFENAQHSEKKKYIF